VANIGKEEEKRQSCTI